MKKVLIFTCFCLLLFLTGNAYADMDIHFLDVGDADAAIVVCDGEVMVIDAGEASHSQLIYSYFRATLDVDSVKYVIMSHPHDDHIGGIPAVLNACRILHCKKIKIIVLDLGIIHIAEIYYQKKIEHLAITRKVIYTIYNLLVRLHLNITFDPTQHE